MNAHVPIPVEAAAIEARFADLCNNRALLCIEGVLELHEAVDEVQGYAKLFGLIDLIGQDKVQHIMALRFGAPSLVPDVDDELDAACEYEIMFGAADLVRRWELFDPRDAWRHTGEAPPPDAIPLAPRRPYRTRQATEDAFFYVLCNERGRARRAPIGCRSSS
jgi:hypothetical protein